MCRSLEAKNNSVFGDCRRVLVEEHSFDYAADAAGTAAAVVVGGGVVGDDKSKKKDDRDRMGTS